jgi:taurine dioxygenase
MTSEITGLDAGESRVLLDEVLPYVTDSSISYRHTWEKGDFLLWDNIALLHARTPYDHNERRLLFRLQLGLP